MMTSVLRVRYNWGSSSTKLLLDWGQHTDCPVIPWAQQVQVDQFIGADYAGITARGNVQREFALVARVQYTDAAVLQYDLIDHDADLPINIVGTLDLRVLNPAVASSSSESARTLAHYTVAQATVVSAIPDPDIESLACTYKYTLRIGAITKL